jgi:murein DD-endopeptidase MepM/ murein hydrolase activator NlpD
MNPFTAYTLWSFRRELFYVSLGFILVLLMPVIAVFILTHAGIDAVSDRLVQVEEGERNVRIFNPDGSLFREINPIVAWPVLGVITLEFGGISLYQPFHTGLDIANANGVVGDSVNPIMPGKVIYAGEIFWGYGKHIIIDHGDNITSIYAHLDKIYVVKGQEIETTKHVIGKMGDTGWSTGPHLHLEVRAFGIPVNPRTFLGGN